ncbi:MAG: hypothetical protein ACTH8J_14745 [Specibacter sp.]
MDHPFNDDVGARVDGMNRALLTSYSLTQGSQLRSARKACR